MKASHHARLWSKSPDLLLLILLLARTTSSKGTRQSPLPNTPDRLFFHLHNRDLSRSGTLLEQTERFSLTVIGSES